MREINRILWKYANFDKEIIKAILARVVYRLQNILSLFLFT